MSISFADLCLLLDIAELGSFSQAAAKRGWSQPQVSQRVQQLEQELNIGLFQRHRRGAEPTAACLAFLPSARQAVSALEQGREILQGTPALPCLRLSCLPSLTSSVFGPLLLALAEAPLEIRCDTDHSQQIMQNLLSGLVQVGFVLRCPAMAGIQMETLWRSPIVAVVAAGHPLAEKEQPLRLEEVASYRIAPQYWGVECDELIRRLRLARTVAQPIHAVQPASAARELAMRHGFLCFLPELSIQSDLAEGVLRRVRIADLPAWQWEVTMAWRTGKRRDAGKELVLRAARALAERWASMAAA
ncbi:LysR family transcriptional regulator [Chromobacterium aquaticum]|uniref:LysR family transcriptional regulator n=1 Tax=Chromobacterium aquaticum TaxID=467180 RepID=A0ABV8ZP98_9NEIS|nr:LysR family transcriptional regulator [Chromobacterium aquaticum]MCD5363220.1 LysR family transcriptional regulator [Chromobacterium aquaticum]